MCSLFLFLFLSSFFFPIPPIYSQKRMSPVPCFVSIRQTMTVSWSSRTPSTPAENQSSPLLKNQVSGQLLFNHAPILFSTEVPPPSSSWLLFLLRDALSKPAFLTKRSCPLQRSRVWRRWARHSHGAAGSGWQHPAHWRGVARCLEDGHHHSWPAGVCTLPECTHTSSIWDGKSSRKCIIIIIIF